MCLEICAIDLSTSLAPEGPKTGEAGFREGATALAPEGPKTGEAGFREGATSVWFVP